MLTMKRFRYLGAISLALSSAFAASAQDYWIGSHTIAGGGGYSAAAGLELEGTIAQPEAGAMAGGRYTLVGGFWPGVGVLEACATQVCGDANCDGSFDGADIDAFFLAVGDPGTWQSTYPGCDLLCVADINGDDSVDGADIDAFFQALGAGSCP